MTTIYHIDITNGVITFDLIGHYREAFTSNAIRAKREHDNLRKAFNSTFNATFEE